MSTLTHLALEFAANPLYDIPNPDPKAPPGSAFILTILSWIKWIGLAGFVGGLMVLALTVALSDGHRVEWGSRSAKFVGGIIGFGAASSIVGLLLA
ncbi:MAG: hypothetical protein L0H79_06990 [Intrasporangium sp.]|uniref:hypothetical protein n=1 Tax=Intrasporangium sp. TaxID=1925024 RepID=UPI002648CE39|nr:hypothetical protein [Intrasporangium sp.]MDN5795484.1 hypothetical protein [Intrasporangium sp.]